MKTPWLHKTLSVLFVLSVSAGLLFAETPQVEPTKTILDDRDTLSDNWLGYGQTLEDLGIETALGLTQIYQINLEGGRGENSLGQTAGTHRHKGRYTGSYDWETTFDLQKLLSIPEAILFVHVEGGWSEGVDPYSVGSLFGVNADAIGAANNVDQAIQVSEVFYEQTFWDGQAVVRVGKLDLTGGFECQGCPVSFDGNAFANDEATQFLNSALVNNPTIPFPDYCLGGVLHVEPIDGVYASVGFGDAQADGREMGFNTAFHQEDYFFGVFETGITPILRAPWGDLQGSYRIGMWYDPQPKERHDTGTVKRDDMGLYLSFDQMLLPEADGEQGLGMFFRYGYADREVNDIGCFWSIGGQYRGLIPCRDSDVLGVGFAQGILSDYNSSFTAWHESVTEVYYSLEITPWMVLTPSVQFVANPGGMEGEDAAVAACRLQLLF
jgi:porin